MTLLLHPPDNVGCNLLKKNTSMLFNKEKTLSAFAQLCNLLNKRTSVLTTKNIRQEVHCSMAAGGGSYNSSDPLAIDMKLELRQLRLLCRLIHQFELSIGALCSLCPSVHPVS